MNSKCNQPEAGLAAVDAMDNTPLHQDSVGHIMQQAMSQPLLLKGRASTSRSSGTSKSTIFQTRFFFLVCAKFSRSIASPCSFSSLHPVTAFDPVAALAISRMTRPERS
jgi:hypothetical protein